MPLLNFIDDKELYSIVENVLTVSLNASNNAEQELYRNVIDPFSALFDALRQKITLEEWLIQEKMRQSQKTLQNALGDFHQKILGSIKEWDNLSTGNVVDIRNNKEKILAEIKNKYNTTKGNHKVRIYDDFDNLINSNYKGFTAYYVEIIPKNPNRYNEEFTPSDNQTHSRRPTNKNIRVIDGYSFYELATKEKDALKKLYTILPVIICNILKIEQIKDTNFLHLFDKAYG